MSKKKSEEGAAIVDGRYEYRVWGEYRKARKLLEKLADSETTEEIDDCYFLTDDPTWNAKVRDRGMKLKQLVAEERGFEVWTSNWHRASKTAPAPFDGLFDDLKLGRSKFDLEKAVKQLDSDDVNETVFVTKKRRRFRIGSIRAEVTDVTIDETGEVMRSLSIEGDDLDELVALRKKLGLVDEDNVPVHVAIGPD